LLELARRLTPPAFDCQTPVVFDSDSFMLEPGSGDGGGAPGPLSFLSAETQT
jgi:hypothetical protein